MKPTYVQNADPNPTTTTTTTTTTWSPPNSTYREVGRRGKGGVTCQALLQAGVGAGGKKGVTLIRGTRVHTPRVRVHTP